MRIEEPIEAKAKIIIETEHCNFTKAIGRGAVLEVFSGQIKRTLEADLISNVFPNAIEQIEEDTIENPLILPETGIELFVFVYLHRVHVNAWGAGSALIEVVMKSPEGMVIKTYEANGESGINLTILKNTMNAVGDAMEKIKFEINKDRNEIIQAIKNK